MKYFNIACGIVILVILAVFAFMLVRNTWPQKTKDCVITINVVEDKGKTTGDEVQITKSVMKDTLQQSAYAARREAQNEYDKNFSTLLAILTIFGIAWPVLVALIQYQFNEKKLDEISTAKANSELAIEENEKLRKEVYYTIAENYYLNAMFWGDKMAQAQKCGDNSAELHGKKCCTKAFIKTIYYYAKSGETDQANSKVNFTIDRLREMQNLPDNQKAYFVEGINWDLFQKLGIKNAEIIKTLSDNVFCRSRYPSKSDESEG